MNSKTTVVGLETGGELRPLLIEWRRLTEREGAAIARNDWNELAEQQRRKTQLREQISSRIQPTTSSGTAAEKAAILWDRRCGLEALLAEIMILEARNRDTLQARRREKRQKLDYVAQTLHRLQRLRRAYTCGASTGWQSYS